MAGNPLNLNRLIPAEGSALHVSTLPAAFRGLFDFPEASVHITVNGETATIAAMSVLRYLESLSIDPQRVAVELNLDILPKAEYGTTLLKEGDSLEIVHFVGGG
jgi:sulfur carrier protein